MFKWLHDWNHFTTSETIGLRDPAYFAMAILLIIGVFMLGDFVGANWEKYRSKSYLTMGIIIGLPVANLVIGCSLGRIIGEDGSNSTLFVIIMIVLYIFSIIRLVKIKEEFSLYAKMYKEYNEIRKCNTCKVYSRQGHVYLYELTGGTGCPVCNTSPLYGSSLDIESNLPLSPKFNYTKCKKLHKLQNDKTDTAFIDEQAELYLKAQTAKLQKMQQQG